MARRHKLLPAEIVTVVRLSLVKSRRVPSENETITDTAENVATLNGS